MFFGSSLESAYSSGHVTLWSQRLIDLHCHILPGIDDGAENIEISLEMARIAAADGILAIACTPHILAGVYNNTGPAIERQWQC